MPPPRQRQETLGADKGYDSPMFVVGSRACEGTPECDTSSPSRARSTTSCRHASAGVSERPRQRAFARAPRAPTRVSGVARRDETVADATIAASLMRF
jgi:hypothetical protein